MVGGSLSGLVIGYLLVRIQGSKTVTDSEESLSRQADDHRTSIPRMRDPTSGLCR
jgi:hypothetical protein